MSSEVQAILTAARRKNPEVAIRILARRLLADFRNAFPDDLPPFNMDALASFRSIRQTEDRPIFSEDAELAPDGSGGVIMRINRDRPRTRQRFSVGHEIGHTLFPGYETEVHCRKKPNRDWADKTDPVESLCDIAASEFLFPAPWFDDDVASLAGTSSEIVALAQKYNASPDATVRRLCRIANDPHAVIFFRWKLKPTERRAADTKNQRYLFGSNSASRSQPKLHVEYPITNKAFDRLRIHIPSDKSVDDDSVISRASSQSACLDAEEKLDMGPLHGRFYVRVFPLYTAETDLGPNGQRSVAALIRPLAQRR